MLYVRQLVAVLLLLLLLLFIHTKGNIWTVTCRPSSFEQPTRH